MNYAHRTLTLTFIVLLLASLFTLPLPSVTAQAGYQPSVPQFTVKLIDNSYDVPPSSYPVIDQYTGQETTKTFPGSYVIDRSIEVMVKNQPFTSYTNTSGHAIELYYIIQVKGHYGEGWRSISKVPFISPDKGHGYTTKQINVDNYEEGSQLDFRVRAVIGYDASYYDVMGLGMRDQYVLDEHVSSNWSSIQTITLPHGTTSSPPSQTTIQPENPSATSGNNQPQQPGQNKPSFVFQSSFLLWLGAFLFVGVVVVVVMVFLRRHLKTLNFNNLTCTA